MLKKLNKKLKCLKLKKFNKIKYKIKLHKKDLKVTNIIYKN